MPTIDEQIKKIVYGLLGHDDGVEFGDGYHDDCREEADTATKAIKSLILSECERAEKKGYKKGVIDLAKARKSAEDRSS